MTEYWKENWDGWPLHSLIAGLSMYLIPFPVVMFIINFVFWPTREAIQHDGYINIFTTHRMLEWGLPIIVAGGMLIW